MDFAELTLVNIPPRLVDLVVEVLQSGVVFVLLSQGSLLALHGSGGRLPASLGLQVLQLAGKSNDIAKACVEGVFDLVEGTIEAAFTADKDALRVGGVQVVRGGRVEGGHVFIGEGEDRVAGVAVAGLDLPEQQRDGALRIVGRSSDGDA